MCVCVCVKDWHARECVLVCYMWGKDERPKTTTIFSFRAFAQRMRITFRRVYRTSRQSLCYLPLRHTHTHTEALIQENLLSVPCREFALFSDQHTQSARFLELKYLHTFNHTHTYICIYFPWFSNTLSIYIYINMYMEEMCLHISHTCTHKPGGKTHSCDNRHSVCRRRLLRIFIHRNYVRVSWIGITNCAHTPPTSHTEPASKSWAI